MPGRIWSSETSFFFFCKYCTCAVKHCKNRMTSDIEESTQRDAERAKLITLKISLSCTLEQCFCSAASWYGRKTRSLLSAFQTLWGGSKCHQGLKSQNFDIRVNKPSQSPFHRFSLASSLVSQGLMSTNEDSDKQFTVSAAGLWTQANLQHALGCLPCSHYTVTWGLPARLVNIWMVWKDRRLVFRRENRDTWKNVRHSYVCELNLMLLTTSIKTVSLGLFKGNSVYQAGQAQ